MGIDSSTLISGNTVGPVTIGGSLLGHGAGSADASFVAIFASKSIGKVSVAGSVTAALLIASSFQTQNTIGAVTVGGDWTASSIVAGVKNMGGLGFGDMNDELILSGTKTGKIGAITIGGVVDGTLGAGDHYGFVSSAIAGLKINGVTYPVPAAGGSVGLGSFGDFTLHIVVA